MADSDEFRNGWCPFAILGEGTICNDGVPYVVDLTALSDGATMDDQDVVLCKPGVRCPAWLGPTKVMVEGKEHAIAAVCRRFGHPG